MAQEFKMGAKMTLKDQFKSTISKISQSTLDFKKSIDITNKSIEKHISRTNQANNAIGRFVLTGKQATQDTDSLKSSMNGLSNAASTVKKAFAAVGVGMVFKAAKSVFIDSNANMETYKNTLTTVLKSEQKATEMLAWAEKFAAKTPFEIPQIVEATTKMSAYGLNAQKTMGIVGDMASVMGKDLMQAVEAVADAQTGQMERLTEFGIKKEMIEAQAKLMKLTVTNNKGQITDQKAFNVALFKLMEDRFKGGMQRQSESFWGMLSNVKDFVSSTLREMGKPMFDKAKQGLGDLLKWLQKLKDNGTIQQWASQVQSLVSKAGMAFNSYIVPGIRWLIQNGGTIVSVLATWGPLVLGLVAAYAAYHKTVAIVTAVTKSWAVMQAILNGTMMLNPIGLVVAGIVVLIAIIILLVKNWDTVKQAVAGFFKYLYEKVMSAPDWLLALVAPMLLIVKHFNEIKEVAILVWDTVKAAFTSGVNVAIRAINKLIKGINLIPGIQIPTIPEIETRAKSQQQPYRPSFAHVNGSHANGLDRVPFDGYVAELHKNERVLTANEARGMDTKRSIVINNSNKFELHQQPGEDADSLAKRVVEMIHDILEKADDIISSDEMGQLI